MALYRTTMNTLDQKEGERYGKSEEQIGLGHDRETERQGLETLGTL